MKISTSLDAGRGAALRRLADALGSTPSALAREALVDLLERRKSEIPPPAPDPRQTVMTYEPEPVDFLSDLFAEATA